MDRTDNLNNKNDHKDHIVNSLCVCKDWYNFKTCMSYPCQHILHDKCIVVENKKLICPICKSNIKSLYTIDWLAKNRDRNVMYNQMYIDMLSVYNNHDDNMFALLNLVPKTFNVCKMIGNAMVVKSKEDVLKLCSNVMDILNIKIHVINPDKLLKSSVVYVANHNCALDSYVVASVLKCGFMSSTCFLNPVNKHILSYYPVLFVNRGRTRNTCNKIIEFVKKNGNICIFPEGMQTHHNTLTRFRSGAFNTGYPVQPIIIKYPSYLTSSSDNHNITRLLDHPVNDIYIYIMDPIYGPFDDNGIEKVRHQMAKIGKMYISRVSNKDVIDK